MNTWWKQKAEEIQEAAEKKDTRAVFEGMRELGAIHTHTVRKQVLKNKEGQIIEEKHARKKRWVEHHTAQLNIMTQAKDGITDSIPQRETSRELDDCITRGEVRRALRQMRRNKAPGLDGIEAEILQALDPEAFEQIYVMIVKAWEQKVRQIFKDACVINLPKKVQKSEELQNCDNHRGINLLSVVGKVFTKVINRRLAKYVEQVEIFPETQNGGRTGRGTSDSTFSIKQICEYRREKNIPTYLTFFDLRKAYDRVP